MAGRTGIHQTGLLVGCLRRLQGWSLTAILAEYHRFAQGKRRYVAEQFIELFDVDLVCVPAAHAPAWWVPPAQRRAAAAIAAAAAAAASPGGRL